MKLFGTWQSSTGDNIKIKKVMFRSNLGFLIG